MKKIAVVGTCITSCNLAPFDDPSWEIWGLAWRSYARVSRLFDIHDRSMWASYSAPDYVERLAQLEVPLYLRAPQPDLPNAIVYPADAVAEQLAPQGCVDLWTSSIAYMLALAICELAPGNVPQAGAELGVFGVDMLTSGEYAYQRPTCEYLIGCARGLGIAVEVPPESALGRANFVYGLPAGAGGLQRAAGITPELLRARLAHYAEQRKAAEERINAEICRLNTIDGAEGETKTLLEYLEHFNRGGVLPKI